jgi:peptide-O-fucosyltransferase
MIDRVETILHDRFGDNYYWQARRSMRYASHLIDIANEYRQSILNSNDQNDRTVIDNDWTKMKVDYIQIDIMLF